MSSRPTLCAIYRLAYLILMFIYTLDLHWGSISAPHIIKELLYRYGGYLAYLYWRRRPSSAIRSTPFCSPRFFLDYPVFSVCALAHLRIHLLSELD